MSKAASAQLAEPPNQKPPPHDATPHPQPASIPLPSPPSPPPPSDTPLNPYQNIVLPPHLRPYQIQAIRACMDALQRGVRRIGVSSPTGSGKTVMFTQLIPLLIGRHPNINGQVLILVGNKDLARQAIRTVRTSFPRLTVELEQAEHRAGGDADVTVTTYQSLIRGDRLDKYNPGNFKAVIVDEAHHAVSPSYMKLLRHFNADVERPEGDLIGGSEESPTGLNPAVGEASNSSHSSSTPSSSDSTDLTTVPTHNHQVPIIGFTATFSRQDKLALSQVFEEIVFHLDVTDMFESGHLSKVKFTSVRADLRLDKINVDAKTDDYSAKTLAKVMNVEELRQSVLRAWLEKAADRKSTLLFAVDIPHTIALTEDFRQAGIDARYVTGSTNDRERKYLQEAFKAGEFPVLVNCMVFLEGTDLPNVDCIVCARPARSRNLYTQMVGRGLRNHPGKQNCLIVDMVDNLSNVGTLMSAPTLWGLQNEEEKELDLPKEDDENAEERSEPAEARVKDVVLTFTDVLDPFRMTASDAKSDRRAFLRNDYCWIACGDGSFVLDGFGHFFSIIREPPSASNGFKTIYLIRHAFAIPKTDRMAFPSKKSPYGPVTVHGKSGELGHALEMGNKLVERYVDRGMLPQLRTDAPWRRGPVSPPQIAALIKARYLTWAPKLEPRQGKDAVDQIKWDEVQSFKALEGSTPAQDEAMKEAFAGMTRGKAGAMLTAMKHGIRGRLKATDRKKAQADKAERKEESRKRREEVKVGSLR